MEIKRLIQIEVKVGVLEVAQAFCEMDGDEQAEFFNYIEQLSNEWERSFDFQLQHITDSKKLTEGGRDIMEQIGAYAR